MSIQVLDMAEIDTVSAGLTLDPGWRIVDPSLWSQYYSILDYPAIPPKYQDGDGPDSWVYC